MWPKALGVALLIVGVVWIVQGLGLARTGSFMDRQAGWAAAGAVAALGGMALLLLPRRRR